MVSSRDALFGGKVTKSAGQVNGALLGNTLNSDSVTFDAKQLQAKFKHAADFGVTGNWNKNSAENYENALIAHINNPSTQVIQGSYRGDPVTHFYNPTTQLNVIQDASGNFLSGWKLTPRQAAHISTGKIGGG